MKRVDVVAAVLYQGDRFFIARRPLDKQLGGLWEFPGGKVEEGESHTDALKREMKEEFDADVAVLDYIASTQHAVDGRQIILHFYRASLMSDSFKVLEHIDSAWCSKKDIKNYELAPADADILPLI